MHIFVRSSGDTHYECTARAWACEVRSTSIFRTDDGWGMPCVLGWEWERPSEDESKKWVSGFLVRMNTAVHSEWRFSLKPNEIGSEGRSASFLRLTIPFSSSHFVFLQTKSVLKRSLCVCTNVAECFNCLCRYVPCSLIFVALRFLVCNVMHWSIFILYTVHLDWFLSWVVITSIVDSSVANFNCIIFCPYCALLECFYAHHQPLRYTINLRSQ